MNKVEKSHNLKSSQKELKQSQIILQMSSIHNQNIDAVPEKPLTTFIQTSIDNMAV